MQISYNSNSETMLIRGTNVSSCTSNYVDPVQSVCPLNSQTNITAIDVLRCGARRRCARQVMWTGWCETWKLTKVSRVRLLHPVIHRRLPSLPVECGSFNIRASVNRADSDSVPSPVICRRIYRVIPSLRWCMSTDLSCHSVPSGDLCRWIDRAISCPTNCGSGIRGDGVPEWFRSLRWFVVDCNPIYL